MKRRIYSVLVENRSGVLCKVAGLFSRRCFNIDSLVVGETDDKEVIHRVVAVSVDNGRAVRRPGAASIDLGLEECADGLHGILEETGNEGVRQGTQHQHDAEYQDEHGDEDLPRGRPGTRRRCHGA